MWPGYAHRDCALQLKRVSAQHELLRAQQLETRNTVASTTGTRAPTSKTNKDSSMTSNDELLYYMLGQVNQERDWDLPQALCATDRCHWQREREPQILRY